jgi:NAD(P)-dependent dehydrogenase (short-subunit alcohol dehydrogenase family)
MPEVAPKPAREESVMGRLQDRVAVITGASRGLGAALAERFAAEGARLVLIARTPGGLEEVDDKVRAAGGEATLVPLDLREGAAIDQLGGALAERFGRVDVLVGNAAELGVLSPVGHIEPEVFERVMALNLGANFRLIRALDPLLRAAPAGRAIFVTADVALYPRQYWGAYAASKAALEALAMAYAAETERTKLRVNLIDPGPMRTKLRAQAYPGEDPRKHPEPASLTDRFVDLADPACERHGELICLAKAAA